MQQGVWDEFLSAPAADAADGFRSGPSALGAAQDAGEAAQRQAFLKWTQGEAMTAQEKAFVEDLWNTDPAKASEYWAAGEFLSTEVPTSSALDGGHLDDTIKTETTAPDSEGLHFDNLQDGIRWEGIIRSVEGGEEVWRSPDIEVRFRRNINLSKAEFERQLYDQQTAINRLTVWKQYGFGSFMSGYLRIINPDEYRDVLDETYARAAIALPVLSTAMGDIIVWEENRYLRIIQYRYGTFTGISAGFDFFWEDVANGQLNSLFDIKTYIRASDRLGIPNCVECFGYVPLLGIGGSEIIENLQKVDMKTHLQIITQFMGKVGEYE